MADLQQMHAAAAQSAEATPTAPVALPTYISFSAEINQHTTETLLGVCGDLISKGVKTIYLMISTPGGNVMNGLTLYNVLRALPIKLIMHNVGNVDSIGNVVFLAGQERYSCAHTTFMFHGVGFDITTQVRLEEKLLQQYLSSMQADQTRIGSILTDRTKITAAEVHDLFLQGVTKNHDFALEKGIIHDVADVKFPMAHPSFNLYSSDKASISNMGMSSSYYLCYGPLGSKRLLGYKSKKDPIAETVTPLIGLVSIVPHFQQSSNFH